MDLKVITALMSTVIACSQTQLDKKKPPSPPPSVQVETVDIDETESSSSLKLWGWLEGRPQVQVFSHVEGRLSHIGFTEGAKIKAKQVLFRIDRNDPGESYLTSPILSPMEGWVMHLHVDTLGQTILPSQPLATLADDRQLCAKIGIPESADHSQFKQSAWQITLKTETRKAQLEQLAQDIDQTTATLKALICVENSHRDWKSGSHVEVVATLPPMKRLLIPSKALIMTDKGAHVFTVSSDNKATKHAVEFLFFSNDQVAVLHGLTPPAKLVILGAHLLNDQSLVSIDKKGPL